jgi:hypothetical protein
MPGGIAKETITVRGLIIPAEWDSEGNTTAVVVSAPGERDYLVDKAARGMELLEFIRKEAEVSGMVRNEDTRTIIIVDNYRLMST